MKSIPVKSIFRLLICLLAFVVFGTCNCNNNKSEQQTKNRGDWSSEGYNVQLQLLKQVRLDTEGPGFILRFADLQYQNHHFYAIGRVSPEIIVYDSIGTYHKTIRVGKRQQQGCSFIDILVTDQGQIFVKDMQSSEILELDSKGDIISRAFTLPFESQHGVQIAPGGLEIINNSHGKSVFTSIFEWYPPDQILSRTFLIGHLNFDSVLINKFAKHDPFYFEKNLLSFQYTTFTIWNDEIYFVEAAVPKIRIYSLSGELMRTFGMPGLHHRQIRRSEPTDAPEEEIKAFIINHSSYDNIAVIRKIEGYENPVIGVTYNNPYITEENIKSNTAIEAEYFLMLYKPDGTLLLNDITLPGRVLHVDDDSNLILLLKNKPDHRIIGFYRLSLIPAMAAVPRI